ncbi:MAG: serpin family protein [Gemmatimonadetes bacterium]|nr:serpin family protein [Gemmatimonadota bacterium]
MKPSTRSASHGAVVSALAAALVLAACASSPTDATSQRPSAVLTALPRALTASEVKVRDASTAFAFALWGAVNAAQRDSNVFVSPLSASFALGMTLNGAAGTTADQLRAALQFGNASQAEINGGYKSLMALLMSLDPATQMLVANSVWYRQGFPFRQAFFDTTRANFNATVQGLDFANTAASLAAINGWVSEQTKGKIPTVLNTITPQQVMFLINAIYFKGQWRSKFDPAKTTAATFTTAGGATQPVQLMHRFDTLSYAEGTTYQAAELPYGNTAFAMTVLLPKSGTDVETLAASLTPASWQAITAGLRTQRVDFAMPKLTLKYERKLNDDLKALGMVVPFAAGGADFTLMAPDPAGHELFIDFVKQNTFVDINEEGTEAAAVTTVGVGVTSMPSYPVMRVDRPYLLVLRERLTGTVLFMGKIARVPSA